MADAFAPAPFASVGPAGIIHGARCWSCIAGHHYPTPTAHGWANDDEAAYARNNGHRDPSRESCGCPCATDAEFCKTHLEAVDEGSWADDRLSLDGQPCPDCGSDGACAYDAEGRPLIHALTEEDDRG